MTDLKEETSLLRITHEIMSADPDPPCYLSPNVEEISTQDEKKIVITDAGTPLSTYIEIDEDHAIQNIEAHV